MIHEACVDILEAAIVVADIDPELDIVFDRTPVMLDMALDKTPVILKDMLVVLILATTAVVGATMVLLATEDVLGAAELAHDTVEGRVTPALIPKRQYPGLRMKEHSLGGMD